MAKASACGRHWDLSSDPSRPSPRRGVGSAGKTNGRTGCSLGMFPGINDSLSRSQLTSDHWHIRALHLEEFSHTMALSVYSYLRLESQGMGSMTYTPKAAAKVDHFKHVVPCRRIMVKNMWLVNHVHHRTRKLLNQTNTQQRVGMMSKFKKTSKDEPRLGRLGQHQMLIMVTVKGQNFRDQIEHITSGSRSKVTGKRVHCSEIGLTCPISQPNYAPGRLGPVACSKPPTRF